MSTKNHTDQSRDADKVEVGNPHYEPKKGLPPDLSGGIESFSAPAPKQGNPSKKGLPPDPSGGIESFSAPPPKKRVTIPIRDKFASEVELMIFTSILGSLPEQAAKVTRFSAKAGQSAGAEKWTLLTDVFVETTDEFAEIVRDAINHSGFKIRQPA